MVIEPRLQSPQNQNAISKCSRMFPHYSKKKVCRGVITLTKSPPPLYRLTSRNEINVRASVNGTLKQATPVTPKNIRYIFVNRTRLYPQPWRITYALSVSATAKGINSQASLTPWSESKPCLSGTERWMILHGQTISPSAPLVWTAMNNCCCCLGRVAGYPRYVLYELFGLFVIRAILRTAPGQAYAHNTNAISTTIILTVLQTQGML